MGWFVSGKRKCRRDSSFKVATMTPESWQKVKEIFHAALELGVDERFLFLSNACGSDTRLRQEVESLIRAHEQSGEFIDSPAYEIAADMLISDEAELSIGQRLGPYEIISTLGKG